MKKWMVQDMRLFKVITVLISILLSQTALANSSKPSDADGTIGVMPPPVWLGNDVKFSMTAYLFRNTQFMKFRLIVMKRRCTKVPCFSHWLMPKMARL